MSGSQAWRAQLELGVQPPSLYVTGQARVPARGSGPVPLSSPASFSISAASRIPENAMCVL